MDGAIRVGVYQFKPVAINPLFLGRCILDCSRCIKVSLEKCSHVAVVVSLSKLSLHCEIRVSGPSHSLLKSQASSKWKWHGLYWYHWGQGLHFPVSI